MQHAILPSSLLGQSSLANKLMRLGVGMLLVALASIGLTLWVT